MQNSDLPLPGVEKISKLIDAVRDYAVMSARTGYDENPADRFYAPSLASWDAFMWFELAQDWELVDYILSQSWKAHRLMRSLQSLLQWYGQTEVDEILARARIMSMIN